MINGYFFVSVQLIVILISESRYQISPIEMKTSYKLIINNVRE
jgi:hypothetical protein